MQILNSSAKTAQTTKVVQSFMFRLCQVVPQEVSFVLNWIPYHDFISAAAHPNGDFSSGFTLITLVWCWYSTCKLSFDWPSVLPPLCVKCPTLTTVSNKLMYVCVSYDENMTRSWTTIKIRRIIVVENCITLLLSRYPRGRGTNSDFLPSNSGLLNNPLLILCGSLLLYCNIILFNFN